MATALNIADLTYVDRTMLAMLARDFCSSDSPTVEVEPGKVDGYAVLLDGPGAEDPERVEAFVDTLRRWAAKAGMRYPLRVYEQGPRGGWRKARATA